MNKNLQYLAWAFLGIGGSIFVYLIIKAGIDGYSIRFIRDTNYAITGQFGDYIGGVVGTLFTCAGTLLIFVSLRLQVQENSKNAFEASFFEMLRLQRENITELDYRKYKDDGFIEYENRQVVSEIFKEFKECYREIKKYSKVKSIDDCLSTKYKNRLSEICNETNVKVNLLQLAQIDLAYSVVYYGLSSEGESIVRAKFRTWFKEAYLFRILFLLKIKPKKQNFTRFKSWKLVRNLPVRELHLLVDELYGIRDAPQKTGNLSQIAKKLDLNHTYEKYYGGHQFRLGHYFRHLFQSFTFLINHKSLTEDEKYSYGKMFRAQLSTYEQALLLVNSLSSLGMKWEYVPDINEKGNPIRLISYFNVIKNIPGDRILDIRFRKYYPNVEYEEQVL
tara:strand:+ start:21721 stop:22890 length:1170 start_codon:yes stop_codon:yes gene_type:complete